MPYKAVIFDLYGTLVDNFSSQAYDQVQEQMAKTLDIPYPKFRQVMLETINDKSAGGYHAVEDNILEICRRLSIKVNTTQIEQVVTLHYEFSESTLVIESKVLEALDTLKSDGLLLGLITNCRPPIPSAFSQSSLAQYIDVPIFSCEERVRKPSRRIYQIACERLEVQPQECLYVGDGSGEELTGAAAVSMLPILRRVDLTDVYDSYRPEVENWQGIAIDEIAELCDIISELA
ncbi:HAD family hydrolase [Candidatus Poribacteria bacterium]|nr:HAD family hydrolase [Candidatus Poribacteria bacterium]MYB01274.1 HAD family hydrolase [Candidatus Poribacteria bacterium]